MIYFLEITKYSSAIIARASVYSKISIVFTKAFQYKDQKIWILNSTIKTLKSLKSEQNQSGLIDNF